METNAAEIHGADWGAAFRDKPIMLKTNREVSAFLQGKVQRNMMMLEDTCTLSTNDSYRNRNTAYEIPNNEKGSAFLDFGFLIRDTTSSLKGSLSHKEDVDFYNFTIPYNRTLQNDFDIQITMELPEGADYTLTLYDEYGNQVGKAEWDGKNRKTLTIPNWDTQTNKYCIRIENADGEEIFPDDYYKIGFQISENKAQEKTDAVSDAYGAWQSAKSKGLPEQQEYLEKYNALLREAETEYTKEVEALHQKQYESLPKEKQYQGGRTVDELLEDMANGRTLSEAELEYVKIYANLQDFEKARQKAELRNDCSQEFVKELEKQGISKEVLEGMRVEISGDGTVTVTGMEDEAAQKQVEDIIKEKYGDRLYRYYIGVADSIGNLSPEVYEYATEVQEVMRYLKAAAGHDIKLEDLYLTSDGKIGGLPGKVGGMINNTENNAKIECIRDMLSDILQNARLHQDIPYFVAGFQFSEGKFEIEDSGFGMDVDALGKTLSPDYGGARTYHYQFKKVF